MSMTIADLEQLQAEHPDWQMELVDGSIGVMGPSDYESDEIGSWLLTFLIRVVSLSLSLQVFFGNSWIGIRKYCYSKLADCFGFRPQVL
jgi:Uma2 family endonuclease